MNKTVELVNEWATFEARHPDADIEDFCRYLIISRREKRNTEKLFGGLGMPPRTDQVMMKLMGRVMRMFEIYAFVGIKSLKINRPEEFYFLTYIYETKNPRKTDVIYANMSELSTGLSILERMKQADYIKEEDDKDDKRSKRVGITPKGEVVLFSCYERFGQIIQMFMKDLPEEDLRLCVQLLQPLDSKFSSVWLQHKGLSFEEVYTELTGEKLSGTKTIRPGKNSRKKSLG